MDLSTWSHRIDELTDENEELRDEIDELVNGIGEVILEIAGGLTSNYCPNCETAAKSLFRLIEEHGDDNAVTDMLEQFAYKTGLSLND